MPAVLPTVNNGYSCLYPIQRQVGFSTKVNQFISGAEQRWPTNQALQNFTLSFSQVSANDRDNLDAFFEDVKGAFDPTWTFQRRGNWLDNGNFMRGLDGWSLVNPSNAFLTNVLTLVPASPGGEIVAYSENKGVTIPGNAVMFADLHSPLLGVQQGFTYDVSFWGGVFTNSGKPSSIVPSLQAYVAVFNASLVDIGTIGSNINLTAGWEQFSFSAPITQTGAAWLIVVPRMIFQNVSSSPVTVPVNCMAWPVNGVSVYPQNVPGAMTHCAFLHDEFTWTENRDNENTYDIQLEFRQTANGGSLFPTLPTGMTTYPGAGPNGLSTGFPFVESDEYYTAMNNMPNGPRYAFSFYGAGLSGFPPRPLKKWALSTPTLTDAQLATVEQEYVNMLGRYASFQFVSPRTGKVHYPVRFDMDALAVQHVLPDVNSCTVKLCEYYDTGFLA